ncbi:MAG: 5-(carboxyamino)imidazole ribonucleotide mutase [Planctomycetota bacterium]
MGTTIRVAVLMGSDSDWPTMEKCVSQLADLGLEAAVEVMSAHRTPERVRQFARDAQAAGFEVLIAAAGLAAGLAGTIAANTTLPVIGVPIASGPLQGVDALLSTVQMPPGVPVATVGIGEAGARNAALLAAQIIARRDPEIDAAVRRFKETLVEGVEKKNRALQTRLRKL